MDFLLELAVVIRAIFLFLYRGKLYSLLLLLLVGGIVLIICHSGVGLDMD
jgi:hypothetical protein